MEEWSDVSLTSFGPQQLRTQNQLVHFVLLFVDLQRLAFLRYGKGNFGLGTDV